MLSRGVILKAISTSSQTDFDYAKYGDKYVEWYKWIKDTQPASEAAYIYSIEYDYEGKLLDILDIECPAREPFWDIQTQWMDHMYQLRRHEYIANEQ